MTTVDLQAFRDAMARFASGVTVVSTVDEQGAPWGFTASAFLSLSLDPPLVLVCLLKQAESHRAFERADHFAVSILAAHQKEVALHFATRSPDKFAAFEMHRGEVAAMPLIPEAVAYLGCRMHDRLPGGDHTILIGEVLRAHSEDRPPLLHHNRAFGGFQEESPFPDPSPSTAPAPPAPPPPAPPDR